MSDSLIYIHQIKLPTVDEVTASTVSVSWHLEHDDVVVDVFLEEVRVEVENLHY